MSYYIPNNLQGGKMYFSYIMFILFYSIIVYVHSIHRFRVTNFISTYNTTLTLKIPLILLLTSTLYLL